jgi:hypothetical protein
MKFIPALFITLFFFGCGGTKFAYAPDKLVNAYGSLKPIEIDSTYKLYVRQIVKTFDSAAKIYRPTNARVPDGKDVIEIEYMLISEAKKQAIILNNIPSIYQNSFNGNNRVFNLLDDSNRIDIDIWYLKQFRFGKLISDRKIKFINADGTGKDHIWNISKEEDTIKLVSISAVDEFGEDVRYIDQAFALEVLFKKVNSFKLLFVYKEKIGNGRTNFDLPNQTFYVANDSKNQWHVIFRFGKPVNGGDVGNVIFTQNEIYAAPIDY